MAPTDQPPSQDLGVHTSQLQAWVRKFADDPQHAFPGQGQMKPEQWEIARLKREVTKLWKSTKCPRLPPVERYRARLAAFHKTSLRCAYQIKTGAWRARRS